MTITQEEFTQIYNGHIEQIYRFCYLKVSSKPDAEDLTQGVFLKLLEYLKDHQEKIENTRAFLYQVARNSITDYYREKGKAPISLEGDEELREMVSSPERPERPLLVNSDMRDVSRALTKINQDYSDLVIWHYIDDLSIPEISRINGKSKGTNRVMLHRALKALKEAVGGQTPTSGV